jgi:hydrogenase 3 maturation protease
MRLDGMLDGRVVVVGVGNTLLGDDGAGPELVRRLERRLRRTRIEGVATVDAGSTPENQLGPIRAYRPDTILLVDAADIGGRPGTCALMEPGELAPNGLSTHDMSLRLFFSFLAAECRARLWLLGVQPRRTEPGSHLSGRVRRVVRRLAGELARALRGRRQPWR